MKNFLCTLFFIQFFFNSLVAQEYRFGLSIGPSISWMTANDNLINSNGSVFGARIAGVMELNLNNSFRLESRFGYGFGTGGKLFHKFPGNYWSKSELSNPDYKSGETPIPGESTLTYKLNQVELGGSIKVLLTPNEEKSIYIHLPNLNIAFINRARGDINSLTINTENEPIKKDVRIFALGWGFGLGFEKDTDDQHRLQFGIDYLSGFTDITDNDAVTVRPDDNGNQLLQAESSSALPKSITLKIAILF